METQLEILNFIKEVHSNSNANPGQKYANVALAQGPMQYRYEKITYVKRW
jgi:hypothetical protein